MRTACGKLGGFKTTVLSASVCATIALAPICKAQPGTLPPPSKLIPPDSALNWRLGTIDRLAWADGRKSVAAYRVCNFVRGDLFAGSFKKRWRSISLIYGAANSMATQYPITLSTQKTIEAGLIGWGYSIAKSRVDALVKCAASTSKTYNDDDLVDASVLAHEEAEFTRKTCDPAKPSEVARYKSNKVALGRTAAELERRAGTAKGERKKRLAEAARIAREREAELPELPEGGPCNPEDSRKGN